MSVFDDITWKDWIFLFIVVLIVIKLWSIDMSYGEDNKIEGFDGNTLSNEAIQSIASLYNGETFKVNAIEVGDITVSGNSTLKGDLDAKNVTATGLTTNTLTVNGTSNLKGDLNNNGSATFSKGVRVSGKHKADNCAMTILDPTGNNNNTHFFYNNGKDTYIGGSDRIIVRTNGYPNKKDVRKVLLEKGDEKSVDVKMGIVTVKQNRKCDIRSDFSGFCPYF